MSEQPKIVSTPLVIFTRTPLHVGAGSSVGAIDQPIQRERHTGFPIIPASSLKGSFADAWNDGLLDEPDEKRGGRKVRVSKDGAGTDAAWLFGSDNDKFAAAGALQLSEARLLAFPVRSAKGSYAWLSCPLMLQRAVRDGLLPPISVSGLDEPADDHALFAGEKGSRLAIEHQVVLEEYTFRHGGEIPDELGRAFSDLLDDPVWHDVAARLVVVSNGMMSYFARNTCEVAQHVRIDDETGTAAAGALFNQENVPSETLFYSVINTLAERSAQVTRNSRRSAADALAAFGEKLTMRPAFQFGGDASTGLGYCTVKMIEVKGS